MNKFLTQFFVPVILALLVLSGCTLAPRYHRPAASISAAWPRVPGYAPTPTNSTPVPAADIGWRDFFRDARLQQLIGLALTNNPNLRAAVFTVEQTRAQYHVQASALIPTVDINANGQRERIPNVFGAGGKAFTYSEYSVDLGVTSYELDLFGQVRSLKKQALETFFASVEARKTAQIALVADVAQAYLTERQATEQLAVAQHSLKAAQQNYDLTRRSFQGGVLSQIDLDAAATTLQTARVAVAAYVQQLAEAQDNLVLLIGQPLPAGLPGPAPFNPQLCLSDIPPGLPSDLLERRPDVLEAEHTLKAANANIGAARAAFFPTITLTGSGGTASTELQNLFAPGSQTWAIEPQLNWPIFDAGTAIYELKASRAAERIDIANYQSAVQTAFRETSDALAVRATVQTQLEANQSLVSTDEKTYQLTQAGFHSGVNSTLDVLAAQQTLDAARQNLIQSQYARLTSLINLYQALGGGWLENSPQSPPLSKK